MAEALNTRFTNYSSVTVTDVTDLLEHFVEYGCQSS